MGVKSVLLFSFSRNYCKTGSDFVFIFLQPDRCPHVFVPFCSLSTHHLHYTLLQDTLYFKQNVTPKISRADPSDVKGEQTLR